MSGIITSPPTPSPDYPNVVVPDYTSQASQITQGMQAAGWFDTFWKSFWEHYLPGTQSVVNIAGSVADDVFSLALSLLGTLQAQGTPGFFTLLATALSDLTGVEFSSSQMQSAWQANGALGANQNIGNQFLTMLSGELQSGVKLPTGPGVSAAEAWLGYGLNFAVREANLSMLAELLPETIRIGEGVREYGVAIAEALGLGRLTRLVMQPFMKILVQDPLTYDLNTAYTPTLLPLASAFKANWRGGMTADALNTLIGQLGYSASAAEQLAIDASTQPTLDDVIASLRCQYGGANAANALAYYGVPPDQIPAFLTFEEAGRSATHLDETISYYQTLMKNRWITYSQVQQDLTTNYGLTQTEVQWAMTPAAVALEYTQAELSQSDLESAYMQGLVTIDYYLAWLARKGYSLSDQAVMQYLLLLKQNKETSAAQLAVWSLRIQCLTDVAKGYPPPPGWDNTCTPPS